PSADAHAPTTRRSRPGPTPALLAALAIALAAPVSAAPVRVVATDARGVTLQVSIGAWSLSAPGRDGRSHVNTISGAHSLNLPGRPQLPAFAATLLLPPEGRPSVRVVATGGEQAREGVKLEVAGRPVFRDDPAGKLGFQPFVEAVEPIADGPWPTSTVSLERPYGFRGRRLVSLEIRPFRYDEASGRV